MTTQVRTKPLWEKMQSEIELGVMAPPVGSIFGPEDYGRGIQAVIDYLTEKWRMGHDTSAAVQLLKREQQTATGAIHALIG